jgi:hypothetical protein
MNLFEQVALAIQAMLRTLRLFPKPVLWVPWLVLGSVQLAIVALLWGFAHPAVSWFMAPLLTRVAGAEVLRYPNLMSAMPDLFSRVDLAIGTLLGSVMIGAATVMFAEQFRGGRPRAGVALREALRRGGSLILAQLPFNVAVVGLSTLLDGWLLRRGGGGLTGRLLEFGLIAGPVVIQSLFLYVAALVMIERRSALSALAALPRTWARGFWAGLALGFTPLVLLLPLHALSDRAALLVNRGDPELVGWLVTLEVVASLGVWFLLAGSATLVYLGAMANPDDGWAP